MVVRAEDTLSELSGTETLNLKPSEWKSFNWRTKRRRKRREGGEDF